jgi:hypothetical protein
MDDAQLGQLLGRVEQKVDDFARVQIAHQVADDKAFDAIRDKLNDISTRLFDAEAMGDSVEANGNAVATLTITVEELQDDRKARETAKSRDSRWIKGIFAIVSLLAADHVIPKFWQTISALLPK